MISIRPGVGMLNLFPHMKYQPWYALGELVDNAIQSYVANRDALRDLEGDDYKLRVTIDIDKADGGSIVVRDNAGGISAVDWPRAFKVAEPPADSSGLSQFGIGMKASCCWFARRWSVRSSSIGEQGTREVRFDVPAIVESRDESLAVTETAEDADVHFTEVRMEGLYRAPQTRTVGKMREYLGGIYRQFLRNEDVDLFFNGERVIYEEPAVLKTPIWRDVDGEVLKWYKAVDLRLDSGRRVKGFVAIREKGATATAGLALFYRQKVVTGAGEETYRPSQIFGGSNDFRSQRLFGELHMDDFNVTYTKDALVWYDEEEDFLELLRKELDSEPMPLLRQAKNYRSRVLAPTPPELAKGVLDDIVRSFGGSMDSNHSTLPIPVDFVPDDPREDADGLGSEAAASPTEIVAADRELLLEIDGTTWEVSFQLIADAANSNWLSVEEKGGVQPSVTIKVNQAHPFMRNYCELPGTELEPVWRVAIAVGLGQALARQAGATYPGLVTKKANALLHNQLATKI